MIRHERFAFEPGQRVLLCQAEAGEKDVGFGKERCAFMSAAKVYDNLVYALSINRLG